MEEELETRAVAEDLTSPNPTSPADPTLQKKHLAMLDRLSNRHQPRNKSHTSSAAFLSQFSDAKHSIESQLADLSSKPTDPALLKSHLARISSSISSLEQLVAESSYLLPSYELRSSLMSISNLKQSLDNLYPKKKFSFKTKTQNQNNPNPTGPHSTHNVSKLDQSSLALSLQNSPGFREKQDQTLTKNFKGSEMGEFTLSDLDSCEVRLIGCVNALFINRLRNCKVYAGPVLGSVLIEQVENCVFVLASHQIRIHCAKGSNFYLRVRSRPIVEDCGRLRFAPYCLRYKGIEEDLKQAGLEEETGNWANVDDFQWLRAVHSPNWSVLEESRRLDRVEVEVSGDNNGESRDVLS